MDVLIISGYCGFTMCTVIEYIEYIKEREGHCLNRVYKRKRGPLFNFEFAVSRR